MLKHDMEINGIPFKCTSVEKSLNRKIAKSRVFLEVTFRAELVFEHFSEVSHVFTRCCLKLWNIYL